MSPPHVIHRALRWSLVLTVTAVTGGCSPKYYAPNTHNTPLLRERGDASLTLAAGTFAEIQAAYAVSSSVGVLFSGALARPKDDQDGDGGRGNFAELGLGFFRPVSGPLTLEIYGLAGGGNLENHFPSTAFNNPGTTGIIEGTVFRYGIQSALGLASRNVDLVFSTRLVALNYAGITGSLVFAGEDQVAYLTRENRQVLFEPAATLRFGAEYLKLQLQLGSSENLTNTTFKQDGGHASLGIVLYPAKPLGRLLP